MLDVSFGKQGDLYTRNLTLPDGSQHGENDVVLQKNWHSPETWSWVTPPHKRPREDLLKEGDSIAKALLGGVGYDYLAANGKGQRILLRENPDLPEVARVPWELASVGGKFLLTDLKASLTRLPQEAELRNELAVGQPLRMALLSASPKDQDRLMVEEELLSLALALSEPMANKRIIVDEVVNCTRRKVRDILRHNRYDIVYFTGHGDFLDDTGYLCLERENRESDLMNARDFIRCFPEGEPPALLFLNCCNAAKVGEGASQGGRGFQDTARQALELGVPEVVATQASVLDITSRKVMRAFFEELAYKYDVARALAEARREADNDQHQWRDFYHFVHFSSLGPGAKTKRQKRELPDYQQTNWERRVARRSENHPRLLNNFVGRFADISQVEDAWWQDQVQTIGLHGIGGIGKTFLASRLEQRALTSPLDAQRLALVVWLDFRPGKGDTLGGFLNQLAGIAFDLGLQIYQKVLDDQDQFPAPMQKWEVFCRHLEDVYGGRVLLVLDNLETVVDEQGGFQDPELGAWFLEMITRPPEGARVLATCRYRFPFFPEGRQLASARWYQLGEMGLTERIYFLDRKPKLRNLNDDKKAELLKAVGGHPFVVNLVAENCQTIPELAESIGKANQQASQYASLDLFLAKLSPQALEWLQLIALFPPPAFWHGVVNAKSQRDESQEEKDIVAEFRACLRELTRLSLVQVDEQQMLFIHPLLVYQLLHNQESPYCLHREKIAANQRAIAIYFYLLARNDLEERSQKAAALLHGAEAALAQPDQELLGAYLQECGGTFYGNAPLSRFSDLVRRTQERLLAAGDEYSLDTLAFLAQTLAEMRGFSQALAIFQSLLDHPQLPQKLMAEMYGQIGRIEREQRQWKSALANYAQAIKWSLRTKNHEKLGIYFQHISDIYAKQKLWERVISSLQKAIRWNQKTNRFEGLGPDYHHLGMAHAAQGQWERALAAYQKALEWTKKTGRLELISSTHHQIGIVYQEQGKWVEALEAYKQALHWKEKTGISHELGSTYHQVGRVYQKQRKWGEALEAYSEALQWNKKTGMSHELGSTYHQVGRVYEEQGLWDEALDAYKQALHWKEKTGMSHEMGGTHHQIGRVYQDQGKWDEALQAYSQALKWDKKTGMSHELGVTYHQIGMVYQEQGLWDEALDAYNQALKWFEKTGMSHELGGTHHQIGMVYQEQGKWDEALAAYNQALLWKEKTGMSHELGSTIHQIGKVHELQGELDNALPEYLAAITMCHEAGRKNEVAIVAHSLKRIYPELPPEGQEQVRQILPEKFLLAEERADDD